MNSTFRTAKNTSNTRPVSNVYPSPMAEANARLERIIPAADALLSMLERSADQILGEPMITCDLNAEDIHEMLIGRPLVERVELFQWANRQQQALVKWQRAILSCITYESDGNPPPAPVPVAA